MTNIEKEQEIQRHMQVLGLTREQAEQLWEDDNSDYVSEEMAEMERKAKANRRYEQSDKPRAKAKRELKIDEDKIKIINFLMRILVDSDVSQLEVKNPQREVVFQFNGADYSLTLTKHRPKKYPKGFFFISAEKVGRLSFGRSTLETEPNYTLYHRPHILSSEKLHKFIQLFIPKFVQNYYNKN